jgi:hypothetical protein
MHLYLYQHACSSPHAGVKLNLQDLPPLVFSLLAAAAKQPDDSHLYEAIKKRPTAREQSLEERMFPYQREGVKFGLRRGGRVLIGGGPLPA